MTDLKTSLETLLPTSESLTCHHFSSEPTSCDPLFTPLPGQNPEPTELESHFFTFSSKSPSKDSENPSQFSDLVHLFAFEIFVYTTASLVTVFVSKADSTGYYRSGLHGGTSKSSPVRALATGLLSWILRKVSAKERKVMLALFARSQSQYLFPGSVENSDKHVLDDRGLIRWWTKILDSILADSNGNANGRGTGVGYLQVPGCEGHELRTFLPRPSKSPSWNFSDPLKALGKPDTAPVRCLVPRFPDDPKARFVVDLDDELPESLRDAFKKVDGVSDAEFKWRSCPSLKQFWELMAYRQECAAGRLVGFLWLVFEPVEGEKKASIEKDNNRDEEVDTQARRADAVESDEKAATVIVDEVASLRSDIDSIVPSSNNLVSGDQHGDSTNDTTVAETISTLNAAHQTGTAESDPIPPLVSSVPSSLRLSASDFARITEFMHTLDYSTVEEAVKSTRRFTDEISSIVPTKQDWALELRGKLDQVQVVNAMNGQGQGERQVNSLDTLKRKKPATTDEGNGVKTLSAGLVRKKPKLVS